MSRGIKQMLLAYAKQGGTTDVATGSFSIKIWISITLLLFTFLSAYCQIEQNQRIGAMIPYLSKNKQSITNYLHTAGYIYANKKGNFSQYKKGSQFAYTFTFSERNSSITALNWTEFLGNYQSIINEIQSIGFKTEHTDTYNSGVALSFINAQKHLILTLITRNELNDIVISLGFIEPNVPTQRRNLTNGTERKTPISSENYSIVLPNPPKAIPTALLRSLSSENFDIKNGTQQGIIQKLFKDEENEDWITICYLPKPNETPYKNLILIDVNTSRYFYPDDLSKQNAEYLKKVIILGRSIDFQTVVEGSGALSHAALVYIKPAGKNLESKKPVKIGKYIRK